MNSYVYVRSQFVGFHCWPEAPLSVKYLRDLHRHLFGVIVKVEVTHDNRQVEFMTLKLDVDHIIAKKLWPHHDSLNNTLSCEQMAGFILKELLLKNYKVVSVEVNEDWENGAIVNEKL